LGGQATQTVSLEVTQDILQEWQLNGLIGHERITPVIATPGAGLNSQPSI
jgi:hypothetical protein